MLCRHNISFHIEIPLPKFLPFVSYSTTIQSQWEDLLFPPSLLLHLKLFSLIRERSSLQLLNSRPVKRNNHIFSPHRFPLCYNSAGKLRKIYTITLQICGLLLNNIRNFFPDIITTGKRNGDYNETTTDTGDQSSMGNAAGLFSGFSGRKCRPLSAHNTGAEKRK